MTDGPDTDSCISPPFCAAVDASRPSQHRSTPQDSWTARFPSKRGRDNALHLQCRCHTDCTVLTAGTVETSVKYLSNGVPIGVMSHDEFRAFVNDNSEIQEAVIESISWWRQADFLRHQYFIITFTYYKGGESSISTDLDPNFSPSSLPTRYDIIFERSGKVNKIFGQGGLARQRVTIRSSEAHETFGNGRDDLIVALVKQLTNVTANLEHTYRRRHGRLLPSPTYHLDSTSRHATDVQHCTGHFPARLKDIVTYTDAIIEQAPYYQLLSLNCYFFARTCFLIIALRHYTFETMVTTTSHDESQPCINRIVYELDCDKFNWGRMRWWFLHALCFPVLSAGFIAIMVGTVQAFDRAPIEWTFVGVFLCMDIGLLILVASRAIQVTQVTRRVFQSLPGSFLPAAHNCDVLMISFSISTGGPSSFASPVEHIYLPARVVRRCLHLNPWCLRILPRLFVR